MDAWLEPLIETVHGAQSGSEQDRQDQAFKPRASEQMGFYSFQPIRGQRDGAAQ
ncbi:hypothetical protein HD842_004040 [Massilia aurea]|uniref:Uncharacterized protein n=1 Tax=Massilia aurea TaxID=373040 RepID=A0A7W9X3K7_9BURK|nr:hypothetical protein [Massilia aurea]